MPYTEASHYELSRVYRDAGPIEKNAKGDDLIPEQVEVERWQDRPLLDTAGLSGRNLCLYLEEGAHTLRLACESESLYVRSLSLSPAPRSHPTRRRPPPISRMATRASRDF